ncbi:MAG: biotin transporter BioY [Leucobacter sp.]
MTDTTQPETAAPVASARPRRRSTASDLALIATFAALIAVCALLPAISVGGLVPITLQTFAVMLAGAALGATRGFLAVLLYLAVGAIGLPVFSGGGAGIAPFMGPSAGYLIAFPLAAALCGFIVERLPRTKIATSIPLIFVAGFASSLVFIHTLGPLGMALFGGLTIPQAFAADLAFYPGDIIKNILMALVATAVHRAFPALLPARRSSRAAQASPAAQADAAPAAAAQSSSASSTSAQ